MLSLLSAIALAAGLDADGNGLPAPDDEGATGLVPAAPRGEAGTGAATLRGEALGGGLVRSSPDGRTTALIGQAAMVRGQVVARLLPWFGASASVPFRLGATSDLDAGAPSLGDLRATAWGVLDADGRQLALGLGSAVPTGSPLRYAGGGRIVPHARLAGRIRLPVDAVDIELMASTWASHEGAVNAVAAVGGPQAGAAARAGIATGPATAGLSMRTQAPLAPEIQDRRGVPLELALDGGLAASERIVLTALVSHGVLGGVGAPQVRASLGASWRWAPPPEPEIVPEVVLPRSFLVVDPDGRPVAGATVVLDDGSERLADVNGRAEIPGDRTATIRARGLASAELPAESSRVVLPWAPIPMHVEITTVDGAPVTPTVTLTGPGDVAIADPRSFDTELVPGIWILEVAAEGYGRQRRSIEVLPRAVEPIELEIVLLPQAGAAKLDLTLSDPQGRAVSGAELRLDGVSIGTAARGTVGIEGLAAAEVAVEVSRKRFRIEKTTVDLAAGDGTAEVGLYYAPGTVRVTARGPGGPITDGLLLVDGPRALPPIPLGDGGESLIELGTGSWILALTSPAHGLQERELEVGPDSPVPLEATFVLLGADPVEPGNADLWVDVKDVEGNPIVGATIRIDAQDVGTTSTGGSLRLEGLAEGEVVVSASGEGFAAVQRRVQLDDGLAVVTLPVAWDPGTMLVAARDPDGPVDALVAFAGPAPYPGGPLGPPGRRTFLALPPGEWEVLASHESGMEVTWATSRPEAGRRTEVDFRLGELSGDGVVTLNATDPDGSPVDGAELWFDGLPIVRTAPGGRVRIAGLPTGPVDLEVRHPHHLPVTTQLDVTADGVVFDAALPWAAGLVDLVVDSAEPLEAALVYASGPTPIDPTPVVEAGRPVRMALAPGSWDLLVSAANGLADAHVEIAEAPSPPQEVRVRVGPPAGAVIHVVDRRQQPLPGVAVHRDGVEVARTDASGTAVVPWPEGLTGPDVAVGAVQPVHPGVAPVGPALLRGTDERWFEVEVLPRPVRIELVHDGQPIAATVTANGPGRIASVSVEGSGSIALPPGRWEVTVDPGRTLAAARKTVEVPLEGDVDTLRFDLVPARVRTTATGLELVDVRFDLGADIASDAYAEVLEEVAATIVGNPGIRRVEVQGHTDATGPSEFNFDLSRRRAASIVAALVELGVPSELLEARGYGPSRPIADNATAEGRAANRRVDFFIVGPDME